MKKMFVVVVIVMMISFFWMGYACASDAEGAIGIIGGDTIIDGGLIGPIYDIFVVKTHTVMMHGLKVVHTREIYTWVANGKLAKRIYSNRTYNSGDRLLSESGCERAYDINGKPQSQDYKRKFNYTYTYNDNEQVVGEIMQNYFYDAKNKYLRAETHNLTYTYYDDGRVNTYQDAYTCTDCAGNVTGSYCTFKEYTYYANGDFYEVDSSRDSEGNLHPFAAYITIMDGQQKKGYGVYYDRLADGQIAYTHTYELSDGIVIIGQNDIPFLSGAGYKSPADIVDGLRSPLFQESVTVIEGDTETIERITVTQSGTIQLPEGVSMTGAMAGKSNQTAMLKARK